MNINDGKICRLCLKLVTNDIVEIDEVMRKMFHILLLKLDLNIIRDPVVCRFCVEIAKKCLKFKLTCLNTEQIILLSSADGEDANPYIKAMCKDSEYVQPVMNEDLVICPICMTRLEINKSVSLDLRNETTMFKEILGYWLEMNVSIFNCTRICTMCRGNLKCFLRFVLNCLDTEEKIKSFCKEQGTGRLNQVNLGNVVNFLSKGIFQRSEKNPQTCTNKEESYTLKEIECVYPEAWSGSIKLEEVDINQQFRLEGNSYKLHPEMRVDMVDNKAVTWDSWYRGNYLEVEKMENSDMSLNKCVLYTDERKRNKEDNIDLINNTVSSKANKYTLCTSEERQHRVLENHVLKVYKGTCVKKKKRKKCKEKNHVDSNKMHKCSLCACEYQKRDSLKRHMLVHKDISEIRMHKCLLCTYQAKEPYSLKSHMLVHKDVSEIKMHKCSLCVYESKHKCNLERHMLVHKDVSEIKMYKCSLCAYQAKHKRNLEEHLFVHKDVFEIKMHKCPLCAYESIRKSSVGLHMITHKDISEIKLQKCPLCAYEAKTKSNLRSHMFVHKDVAELQMHKCSLCAYEAKYKRTLKKHMLGHNIASATTMHKCSLCGYAAIRKSGLTRHMLVHKNVLEINN